MNFALISLSLGAAAAPHLHEPVPRVITHFASASHACGVLQAAYTAASGHKALIYPQDVRSDTRVLELDKFAPEYRAKLTLSVREFDELTVQQGLYNFPNFKPVCNWKGDPGPSVDDEGHATFVTFTNPIFANSRRLAIVQVSFREKGTFGYGLICVVRQGRIGWEGQCQNSWIT